MSFILGINECWFIFIFEKSIKFFGLEDLELERQENNHLRAEIELYLSNKSGLIKLNDIIKKQEIDLLKVQNQLTATRPITV